ncbi:MAG TPA: hypothetical protein VGM39_04470 [Kofleriaceae bacterium]
MVWLGFLVMLVSGCVFPPDLSVDTSDGGVNSPPAIMSISADEQVLSDSGTVTFTRGANDPQMVLGLLDNDVNDTLYVGIYINYTVQFPEPARATRDCPTSGQRTRTCTIPIAGLCPAVGNGFAMTVQVFDRPLAEDNSVPLYKAMIANSGGLTTNRSYTLNCQ